jgi:hypothetical protein
MLEPAPGDVLIASLGAPAVLALVLLGFVVACARFVQRKQRAHRRLHVAPRPTVRRAA